MGLVIRGVRSSLWGVLSYIIVGGHFSLDHIGICKILMGGRLFLIWLVRLFGLVSRFLHWLVLRSLKIDNCWSQL